MKTYSKPNRSVVNNSLDAGKILFNGIRRKRKKKIQIKDLPVRAIGETFLRQDSFHVSTEDTFDKLMKGNVYNPINIKSHISIVNNSDSDASKSIKRVNNFYSPIMTRRRKKSASVTEISSSSNIGVKLNKIDDSKSIKMGSDFYSPIMTRSRKRTTCGVNTTDNSINTNEDNRSDSGIPHFKEPTVEKIDFSLEVEKVRNPVVKSLSYIVIPEVEEGENSVGTVSNGVNAPKADTSFESIFTKTFCEKQFIHSSTPLLPMTSKKIVNYTISPIKNSFTPLKRTDHTNIEYVPEKDWKLTTEPKVMLSLWSKKEIPSLVNNDASEKLQSKVESQQFIKIFSDKENFNFARNSVQQQLPMSNMSRESFITLRRRKILKPISLLNRKRSRNFKGYANIFDLDHIRPEQKSSSVEDCSAQLEEADSENGLKLSSKLISREDFSALIGKVNNENTDCSSHKLSDLESFEIRNGNLSNSKDLEGSNCKTKESEQDISRFVNKRSRKISDSCLIINKKQKTDNKETPFRRRSFQENSISVYSEVLPQDIIVHLPKINFVLSNTSTNSLSTDESGASSGRNSSRQSITNSSNTDMSIKGSSNLSDSDFFKIKRPVFKDFVVDLTKMVFTVPSSTDPLPDNSKSLFESDSTHVNNRGPNNCSISVDSQTTEDLLSNVIEKSSVIEKGDVLNLEEGAREAWQGKGVASIISSVVLNNNSVDQLDNNQGEEVRIVPVEGFNNKFIENFIKRSRSIKRSGQKCDNDKLSQVSAPSFHNDFVNEEPTNKELIVNLTKSPWRRKGKQDALSSGSSAESQVIDLTDSFENRNRKSDAMKDVSTLRNKNSNISDIIESSVLEPSRVDGDGFKMPVISDARRRHSKTLVLKAGKLWRRSLAMFRRSSMVLNALNEDVCRLANGNFCTCFKCNLVRQSPSISSRRHSIRIVPVKPISDIHREISILENYAHRASYVSDRILEDNLENDLRSLSLSKRKDSIVQNSVPLTARELVLKKCGQEEPLPFEECYSESLLQNCQKIGEGVYGEVFLFRNPSGGTSVMKVIPIEGDQIVNGERQKKFDEILSEITIALELSNLRNSKHNKTSGFSEVQKVCCTQGRYPEKLVDLWDLYDETRGSENDSPEIFGEDQLYIILQLANGGRDLEAFIFNNALQAYTMFQQVACTLAVAEEELHFEHRDLHWGNILLSTADKNSTVTYRLDGKNYDISTRGVEVAIIDFTLSRIECEGVVIFNDLSLDPDLFTADGDYQFEIYKLMQKKNGNNWQRFEAYTNVLWLHYTLDKAVTALRYKNTQSKVHKEYLGKLRQLRDEMLKYGSAKEFVLENF